MSDERRAYPRIVEENTAIVQLRSTPRGDETVGEIFHCMSTDISAGGISLDVEHGMTTGSSVHVMLPLREPRQVFSFVGSVCWSASSDGAALHRIGVGFDRVELPNEREWHHAIETKLANAGAAGTNGT